MTFDQFLQHWNLGCSQLLELVDSANGGQAETVICGGSLAEGFGTPRSDLDLYSLSETKPMPQGAFHEVSFFGSTIPRCVRSLGAVRLDIKLVTMNVLASALADLESLSEKVIEDEAHIARVFPDEAIVAWHRLANGLVLRNSQRREMALERLQEGKPLLASYLASQCACSSRWEQRQALNAKRGNQIERATWHTRRAFECAVDTWLAMRGQTNPRFDKWRFNKLLSCPDSEHIRRSLAECYVAVARPYEMDISVWLHQSEAIRNDTEINQ